jgi:DNA polymerase-3 subunit epsilon
MKLTRPLASIDIESTGTDPARDRIITLAAIIYMPNGTEYKHGWMVNPGMRIPKDSTECHGITDDKVKDCPPFKGVANGVMAVLDGCDLTGFGLTRFDVPILHEELWRAGIEWDLNGVHVIDAGSIFQQKEPRTLTAAMAFYCGETLEDAHDATADAVASYKVLQGQLQKYSDLSEMSVEDLAKFSKRDNNADLAGKLLYDAEGFVVYNIGKSKGVRVKDDPSFAHWMLAKDFTQDTRAVLNRELNKHFSQSSREMAF